MWCVLRVSCVSPGPGVARGWDLSTQGECDKIRSVESPLLHIALYQPEIPQNTGAIGRTCVALGAKLWIVRPTGFRLDNHHLRRSGLDYWQHLDWQDVANWGALEQHWTGRRIFLVTRTARQLYTEVRYERGDCVVFGRESSGLPRELHERYADRRVAIPMRPAARSLNLANAVAIVGYEAWRQIASGDHSGRTE